MFTRYLIGADPTEAVARRYQSLRPSIPAGLDPDRVDRLLLRVGAWTPVTTRIADAYSRIFRPTSALRQTLVLLLAVLETSSPTDVPLNRAIVASPIGVVLRLGAHLAAFGFALAAGSVLLGPAHLVLRALHPNPGTAPKMTRVLVIGSGASGVHFALSALERGYGVTLVDVGYPRPDPVAPDATFEGLKRALPDPAEYFLGARGQGIVYPATKSAYYGHPPSKEYVFRVPSRFRVSAPSMEPHFSFARGGLAEAWTAGSYPFNDADLEPFGLRYDDLGPHYRAVTRRIGIGGTDDDLARFIPFDGDYLEPIRLDPHSALLLSRYRERAGELNRSHRFYLGRSRVATLSRDYRGRLGCGNLGRCLWGCPRESIYSPAVTLEECLTRPGFEYVPGTLIRNLTYDADGTVTGVVGETVTGQPVTLSADRYALAAGTLASAKIVLDSVYRHSGQVIELGGLMDNRQIHVPFLTPALAGTPVETASYQYHHLAFGIPRDDPAEYIHGQITTLKAAAIHPIVQSLPVDLKSAIGIFRATRTGLGIANVNLPDWRRPESRLTIRPLPGSAETELVIRYADDPREAALLRAAVTTVKRALRALGAIVPPGLTRVLPKGGSVHYCGTLPFSPASSEWTCSLDGRLRGFGNLWVVDGSTFPFLPAKNLTFTLMANAARIAAGMS